MEPNNAAEVNDQVVLSAPSHGGYRQSFDTEAQAREKAAELLGVTVAEMIEVDTDSSTYCYATQEEADADRDDGAYAVKYCDRDLAEQFGM